MLLDHASVLLIVRSLFVITYHNLTVFSCFLCIVYFFFFKQKTADEMRSIDWSSDVCSSDLCPVLPMSASANKVRAHRSPRGRGGRAFRSDGTGYGEMRQDARQVRNRRLRPRPCRLPRTPPG